MKAWTARNPLGIIALFISLIYGMSALLLGVSVSSLSPTNQTTLVWFIVLFPIAVLAAFLWLVANHHRKLYSPGDYRSDEGFLTEAANPQHLGERLVEEVQAIVEEEPVEQPDGVAGPNADDAKPALSSLTGSSYVEARRGAVATAYLAEGLAFKELQSEFGGQVRQHVRVRTASGRFMEIDGVIEGASGSYIVEVKLLRSMSEYRRRIREALGQIERIYLDHDGFLPGTKGLLVLVTTGQDIVPERLQREITEASEKRHVPIGVRVFALEQLLEKYGFGELKTFD